MGRVHIEDLSDGVRVLVPPRRSRWAVAGIVVLLPAFAFALLAAVVSLTALVDMTSEMQPAVGVVVFALIGVIPVAAVILTAVIALRLLYGLIGREVVTATPWMLTDTKSVALFSRKRHWPTMRISDLRLSPMAGGALDVRHVARHGLLFEVDATKTRTIAEGCTPAEAAAVFDAVDAALSTSPVKRRSVHGTRDQAR